MMLMELSLLRAHCRRQLLAKARPVSQCSFSTSALKNDDSRLKSFGRLIDNEYAAIRDQYRTPKNPIVLTHGLLGFDELHLLGKHVAGIQYWRGIVEALRANSIEVFTASVPPSGSIQKRAAKLRDTIERVAQGRNVNIIAHSMGGLDSRYMISQMKPQTVNVKSLTTIATPHRGSVYADHLVNRIGETRINRISRGLRALGIETDAFLQLTTKYMREEFNPSITNSDSTKYYSYGAFFRPPFWSMFRHSHAVVTKLEGPNDGLVSVASSQWGQYRGTLANVSHMDLINWTNRMIWYIRRAWGLNQNFNAIAFYLDIADMLAKKGL